MSLINFANCDEGIREDILKAIESISSDDVKTIYDALALIIRYSTWYEIMKDDLIDLMLQFNALGAISKCLNDNDPRFTLNTLRVLTFFFAECDLSKREHITFLFVRAGILHQLREIVDLVSESLIQMGVMHILAEVAEYCAPLIMQLGFIDPIVCRAIDPLLELSDRNNATWVLQCLREAAALEPEYFFVYLDGIIQLFGYVIDFNDKEILKQVAALLSELSLDVAPFKDRISAMAQPQLISKFLFVISQDNEKERLLDDILENLLAFVADILGANTQGNFLWEEEVSTFLFLLGRLVFHERETIRMWVGRCYIRIVRNSCGLRLFLENNLLASFLEIVTSEMSVKTKLPFLLALNFCFKAKNDDHVEEVCSQGAIPIICATLDGIRDTNVSKMVSSALGGLNRIVKVENTDLQMKYCSDIEKSGVIPKIIEWKDHQRCKEPMSVYFILQKLGFIKT